MRAHVAADTAESGPHRYVRFRKLLAGRGSTALDMHVATGGHSNMNRLFSYWAHMCAPWPWRSMRDVAYGNNGVAMTPAARLKPLVVISDGQPHEKRRFENGRAIAAELRRELPGVDVQWVAISSLSGAMPHARTGRLQREHLRFQVRAPARLRHTCVFVSPTATTPRLIMS